MDESHADLNFEGKSSSLSYLPLFSELVSEEGKNGKLCVSLLKCLKDNRHNVDARTVSDYPIKRLVRSLGSSRLNTQCACFAALSCVLRCGFCSVDEVLRVVDANLGASSHSSGSDKVGATTASLLACGAVIQSGVYADQPGHIQKIVVEKIISAGKARSYLTSVAYNFLTEIANLSNQTEFKTVLWAGCKNEIKLLEEISADQLHFVLFCLKKYPKVLTKYVIKQLGSVEILIEKAISSVLSHPTKFNNHPAYESLAQYVAENGISSALIMSKTLGNFSKVFAPQDNAVVYLYSLILNYVSDKSVIPELLTEKFLEVLLRVMTLQRSQKNGKFNSQSIGRSLLNLIVSLLSQEDVSDSVRLQTIERVMKFSGIQKFESKTGFKLVHLIIQQLKMGGIKELTAKFHLILIGRSLKTKKQKQYEGWNNREKQYILHLLVKLMNYPVTKGENEWKLNEIKFIFQIAFIDTKYPNDVKKCAQDCFYKATELQQEKLNDLLPLLNSLVEWINEKITKKEVTLSGNLFASWEKVINLLKKLRRKSSREAYSVIHVLLVYMSFQLFSEGCLAKSAIEELESCYLHLKKTFKDENLPEWTEVTTDLILSLLSKGNNLWRRVVSLVFPHLVPYMTSDALHLIIVALDPQSKKNVFKEHLSADSEEENTMDEDDSSNSDVSESSVNGMDRNNLKEEEEEKEDEDEEDDDDDDDDDDEEEEETVNDQLRMAIRGALGYSAALTDEESVDMDDMNAEEEERLNKSLSEAFRMFKSNTSGKQKKQSYEEEAIMHFRARVLDLIDTYLSVSPSMSGCLDLILPLFELLEFSIKSNYQKPLQNRLDSVLKKLAGVKKFSNMENVSNTVISDIFKAITGKKEIPGLLFVEMSARISECCSFLVKCCDWSSNLDSSLLQDEYLTLLRNSFEGKDTKIPNSLFEVVLRGSWKGNWKIMEALYELLTKENIRVFKKSKIIDLLLMFYRNGNIQNSATAEGKEQLNYIENLFIRKLTEMIEKYEQHKSEATDKAMLNLFRNILLLMKAAISCFNKYRKDMKKPPWNKVIAEMMKKDFLLSNQKCRQILCSICNMLNIAAPKVEKEKKEKMVSNATENSVAEETKKVKKAKKKKSAEIMKMKKESLKLREAISSEGLESCHFSSVNLVPDWEAAKVDKAENGEGKKISRGSKRKKDRSVNIEPLHKSKSKKFKNH